MVENINSLAELKNEQFYSAKFFPAAAAAASESWDTFADFYYRALLLTSVALNTNNEFTAVTVNLGHVGIFGSIVSYAWKWAGIGSAVGHVPGWLHRVTSESAHNN